MQGDAIVSKNVLIPSDFNCKIFMLGLEVNMNSSDEEFLNAELDAVEADQVNQV